MIHVYIIETFIKILSNNATEDQESQLSDKFEFSPNFITLRASEESSTAVQRNMREQIARHSDIVSNGR